MEQTVTLKANALNGMAWITDCEGTGCRIPDGTVRLRGGAGGHAEVVSKAHIVRLHLQDLPADLDTSISSEQLVHHELLEWDRPLLVATDRPTPWPDTSGFLARHRTATPLRTVHLDPRLLEEIARVAARHAAILELRLPAGEEEPLLMTMRGPAADVVGEARLMPIRPGELPGEGGGTPQDPKDTGGAGPEGTPGGETNPEA